MHDQLITCGECLYAFSASMALVCDSLLPMPPPSMFGEVWERDKCGPTLTAHALFVRGVCFDVFHQLWLSVK